MVALAREVLKTIYPARMFAIAEAVMPAKIAVKSLAFAWQTFQVLARNRRTSAAIAASSSSTP